MTFAEMIEAVRNALVNDDFEELEHLKNLDAGWYHSIIEEFILDGLNKAVTAFKN